METASGGVYSHLSVLLLAHPLVFKGIIKYYGYYKRSVVVAAVKQRSSCLGGLCFPLAYLQCPEILLRKSKQHMNQGLAVRLEQRIWESDLISFSWRVKLQCNLVARVFP